MEATGYPRVIEVEPVAREAGGEDTCTGNPFLCSAEHVPQPSDTLDHHTPQTPVATE